MELLRRSFAGTVVACVEGHSGYRAKVATNCSRTRAPVHPSRSPSLRWRELTRPAMKSDLLRAGIAALNAMNDQALLAVVNGVPSMKTGRPKGSDAMSG